MSYQKQNFANGEVLTASQLNHMEDGIAKANENTNSGSGLSETSKTLLLSLWKRRLHQPLHAGAAERLAHRVEQRRWQRWQ